MKCTCKRTCGEPRWEFCPDCTAFPYKQGDDLANCDRLTTSKSLGSLKHTTRGLLPRRAHMGTIFKHHLSTDPPSSLQRVCLPLAEFMALRNNIDVVPGPEHLCVSFCGYTGNSFGMVPDDGTPVRACLYCTVYQVCLELLLQIMLHRMFCR